MLSKKRIHFIGIGGIGMSALALCLVNKGFKISGSDIATNNNIENLEWCTHKYNCNYGNRKNGNQDKTKKVAQYDLNGNLIKVYESLRQAEKETNTPKSSGIAHCCRGKQKTYINFKWKYYEED